MISSISKDKLIAAGKYYFNLGFECFPSYVYLKSKNGDLKKIFPNRIKWKSETFTLRRFIHLVNNGNCNTVCIKTGLCSNLFVLDVDIDCKSAKQFFQDNNIIIPKDTPHSRTQGGRFHIWFTFPKKLIDCSTGSDKINKVDWRGNGGLIFAPPTDLGNDRFYKWLQQINPDKSNLRTPPVKLIEWILNHKPSNLINDIPIKQNSRNKGIFANMEPNFTDSYGKRTFNDLTPSQKIWHDRDFKILSLKNEDRSTVDCNYMVVANKLGLHKKVIYDLVKDKSKFTTRQFEYFERTYRKAVSICKGN